MKPWSKLLIGAVLMSPMAAMAAMDSMGSVSAYLTRSKLEMPGIAPTESGTGFGLKGWYSFGIPFVHAEYQQFGSGDNVSTLDIKQKEFRLGGGAAFNVNPQVLLLGKLEYVKETTDQTAFAGADLDLDGFGIHAGAIFMPMPALHVGATVGYLALGGGDPNVNSQGDTKGLEYNLGAGYNFTKQWGAFLDYRKWNGKFDASAGASDRSWNRSDIRLGATFSFGGK